MSKEISVIAKNIKKHRVAQNGILMVTRKRETAEEVGKLFGW